MLKIFFSLTLIAGLASCSFINRDSAENKTNARKVASSIKPVGLPMEIDTKPQYCAAIRGNGELAPSHWSALSRIVENLGMPKAMSGGSSASITMFYMESIAANPILKDEGDPEFKRRKQALLLKTIPVYKKLLAEFENVNNTYKLLNELKASNSKMASGLKASFAAARNRAAIQEAVKKYGYVFNPEFLQNIQASFAFSSAEVQDAISVFGAFDAVNDKNLFFRPGLVDFKYFALIIGRVGDFYAGNSTESVLNGMNTFLNECADSAYGRLWPSEEKKLKEKDDICKGLFAKAALEHIKQEQTSENLTNFDSKSQIFKKVGASIMSFPTTSIVEGDSYKAYMKKAKEYKKGTNQKYEDFSIDGNDIKFGYWGESHDQLEKLATALKEAHPNDVKSNKFKSLGSGNWFEVLSTSPAEPGLANFQKIMRRTTHEQVTTALDKGLTNINRWGDMTYKNNFISAGGWSDLQPSLVLRAHGCENIVFLTRTDGPSLFGQQVFIRLAKLTEKIPFWDELKKHNKDGWDLSGKFAPAKDTDWYKLYSINNDKSSHNISVKESDAVYCTNWNAFSLFKGQLNELWADAYNSPMILKEGTSKEFAVTDVKPKGPLVGCM